MAVLTDFGQSPFDRLIADHYETVKGEVLATVRSKLAAAHLHPDPLDLDAAYNAAWHALYERSVRGGASIENLGGWLATIAYRRAIDDVRSAQPRRHAAVATDHGGALGDGRYERDVDDEISSRQKYHQWLMSVRLRLSTREQQAVSLCVLHEHSRREASEIMGIDVKRLDKVMTAANKKLGGALEAISRGDWCEDQRSLIKAYAFGLHDEGGKRHTLAIQHIMQCHACAAYVRSVRDLAGVMPPPAVMAGAVSAGGGILSGLTALFKGGTGAAAAGGAGSATAGGGGATVLGGLAAKGAVVCATAVCATGGTLVVIDNARSPVPKRKTAASPTLPVKNASARIAAARQLPTARTPVKRRTSSASASRKSSRPSATVPDHESQAAQEIAELGIEPQATQASTATRPPRVSAAAPPPLAQPSEFDFEGG